MFLDEYNLPRGSEVVHREGIGYEDFCSETMSRARFKDRFFNMPTKQSSAGAKTMQIAGEQFTP
jgi:hypothetical protein